VQRKKYGALGKRCSPTGLTPVIRMVQAIIGAGRNAHTGVMVTVSWLRLRGGRVLERRDLVTRPQRLAMKSSVRGSPATSESTARRPVIEQEQQQVVGERWRLCSERCSPVA
jgi:hypothetical protein